jgi:hypothetical protein
MRVRIPTSCSDYSADLPGEFGLALDDHQALLEHIPERAWTRYVYPSLLRSTSLRAVTSNKISQVHADE